MPTCCFLFAEKPRELHLKSDMIKFWNIPIRDLKSIKEGNDWISPDGDIVKNALLTNMPTKPRKYAYCSDTSYIESIIPIIEGVDLLFHEATFAESEIIRAQQTCHSTAKQAATIALKAKVGQLMIGHFSARYEDDNVLLKEAREIFENTILANEGLSVKI